MRKTEHDDPAYCHYQSKQWEEQPGEIQHLSGGGGGRNSGSPGHVSVCLCVRVWRDAVSWSRPTLGPGR